MSVLPHVFASLAGGNQPASYLDDNFNAVRNVTPALKSTTYTTVVGDHLLPIYVTGNTTINLGDAATMVAGALGYEVIIINVGTGTVTVALSNATNTLSGIANGSVTLATRSSVRFGVNTTSNGYEMLSGGFLAAGTGATSRDLQSKTRELCVTPQDFGAVGDGSTDDTTALNNWLACSAKRKYAPAATYKYTSALTPISNSDIYGDGDATLFQGAANCVGFSLVGLSNVSMRDLKLDGAKATYTTTTNDGLSIDWTGTAGSNISINRVTVTNVAGAGIKAIAASGKASSKLTIQDCHVTNTGAHGILSQDYISDVVIRDNYVEATALLVNDRPGISASRNGSYVVIAGNICVGSASSGGTSTHGISLDTTTNVVCSNNVVTGWTKGFGIEVGFCTNATINGNSVTGCNGDIVLSGAEGSSSFNQNVTITGNTSNATITSAGAIYAFMTGGTGAVMHTNIVVSNNTVQGATTGSGIEMSFCDKLSLSGNACYNNFLSGIYVLDCKRVNLSGNSCVNNNCVAVKTISALTQAAGTATATSTAHGYSTNDVVTIFGATPSEYNGVYTITVVDANTFTYIHTTPAAIASPAAGTIQCTKYNSSSHAGVRAQWSTLAGTDQSCIFGMNLIERNGNKQVYDVSVNSISGFINDVLILRETNSPRAENLTSGVNANEEDRVGLYMKDNKLVFAYNNAGTITFLAGTLDGATATLTNSTTVP